jgi:hypothetical protein
MVKLLEKDGQYQNPKIYTFLKIVGIWEDS